MCAAAADATQYQRMSCRGENCKKLQESATLDILLGFYMKFSRWGAVQKVKIIKKLVTFNEANRNCPPPMCRTGEESEWTT